MNNFLCRKPLGECNSAILEHVESVLLIRLAVNSLIVLLMMFFLIIEYENTHHDHHDVCSVNADNQYVYSMSDMSVDDGNKNAL